MKKKHFIAVLAVLTMLAFAASALAADGTVNVTVLNKAGVKAPGTVYAIKGSTTKTCNASAGVCSLTLATGTWTIYAKNSAGGKSGAINKSVVTGTNTATVKYP
jgi:hypothetical protein